MRFFDSLYDTSLLNAQTSPSALSPLLVHAIVSTLAYFPLVFFSSATLDIRTPFSSLRVDAFYRLTRELEKKFSDRTVVFVAQRRMVRKPGRTSRAKQPRPRSRTLKAVHEAILEDLVYPTEITGKRTRQSTDGNRTIKVYVCARCVIIKYGALVADIPSC